MSNCLRAVETIAHGIVFFRHSGMLLAGIQKGVAAKKLAPG